MPVKSPFKIGRKRLDLSNLDKVLYPSGFTKGQVIDYYRRVAPVLLPHLKGRPLTLKRYPNGSDGMFFFEKRCPSHRPDWIRTADVASDRQGYIPFCVIGGVPDLIWVANLASLELHVPMARADKPDRPTAMVFDLDPGPPATLLDCLRLSLHVRDMLDHLGLKCFAKTSGKKGLHLYVPLNGRTTSEQSKDFAHAVADVLAREDPAHVTSQMSKSLRPGKVFVDWSQNDPHKTTVCVYSLRAADKPTVSTPVAWREIETALSKKDPSLLEFEAGEVLKRIASKGDLFEPLLKLKQPLPKFG